VFYCSRDPVKGTEGPEIAFFLLPIQRVTTNIASGCGKKRVRFGEFIEVSEVDTRLATVAHERGTELSYDDVFNPYAIT
jgi:hypothetical protein